MGGAHEQQEEARKKAREEAQENGAVGRSMSGTFTAQRAAREHSTDPAVDRRLFARANSVCASPSSESLPECVECYSSREVAKLQKESNSGEK